MSYWFNLFKFTTGTNYVHYNTFVYAIKPNCIVRNTFIDYVYREKYIFRNKIDRLYQSCFPFRFRLIRPTLKKKNKSQYFIEILTKHMYSVAHRNMKENNRKANPHQHIPKTVLQSGAFPMCSVCASENFCK